MNTFPKVLYFIAGMAPSAEQISDADVCGPGVAFRNATLIRPENPIEDADAVAGPNVPDNYAAALPHISDREAVKERMIKRNPILAQMRGVDTTTPKPPSKAERAAASAAPVAPAPTPAPAAEPVAPATDPAPAQAPQAAPQAGWGTDPAATAPPAPPAPAPAPAGKGKGGKGKGKGK